jgi:hypothetical protein
MAIIEFGTERPEAAVEPDLIGEPTLDDVVCGSPAAAPVVTAEARLPRADRRPFVAGLKDRLSGRRAAALAVAWVGIFTTGVALEPAPANPDAPLSAIEGVLVSALMLGWIAMAVGFALRRRWGAAASLVGAVGLVGLTIACQTSGHHSDLGAWWWFQAAGSTTLVVLSARALRVA